MMLSNDDIEDLFRHHRKHDHHQRPDDGADQHTERDRRITSQVLKNPPDSIHPGRAIGRIGRTRCVTTSRNIFKSSPSASPRPSPSANPAVLIFITMLTSAFTLAASPALPMKRTLEANSLSTGTAFRKAFSFPPHIK